MSEADTKLITELRGVADVKLDQLADDMATKFVGGLKEILSGASRETRDRVATIVRQGASYKVKAVTAKTAEEARLYAGEAETCARRIRTILLAEKVVAEDKFANMISDLFGSALTTLGSMAKGLIGVIAEGIARGAISGLTGGGGEFDSSQIFPFA